MTLIQLTPNLWVYLLGFARFATWVLGEKPNVSLFGLMFIPALVNRGNSDRTYALSGANRGTKGKFKGLLSKVHE